MNLPRLREKIEDIVRELEAGLLEADAVQHHEKLLLEREAGLRDMEQRLEQVQTQQQKTAQELDAQKGYVEKATITLTNRQTTLDQQKASLVELERSLQVREQTIERKKPLIAEEEKKLAEIATLSGLQEEIKQKQTLLDQREYADVKRKEILDLRERKIKLRETQLQMEAEI